MKRLTLILAGLLSLPAWAIPSPCNQYKEVKARLSGVREQDVDRLIQNTQWLDEHYEQQDQQGLAGNILRLMVMGVSWHSFIFIPTRVETATMTGFYSRNPENFVRFLQLETRQACRYLAMPDSDADRLRAVTREAWQKINNGYINNVIRRNDREHRR